jgi:hypothetical protein
MGMALHEAFEIDFLPQSVLNNGAQEIDRKNSIVRKPDIIPDFNYMFN